MHVIASLLVFSVMVCTFRVGDSKVPSSNCTIEDRANEDDLAIATIAIAQPRDLPLLRLLWVRRHDNGVGWDAVDK